MPKTAVDFINKRIKDGPEKLDPDVQSLLDKWKAAHSSPKADKTNTFKTGNGDSKDSFKAPNGFNVERTESDIMAETEKGTYELMSMAISSSPVKMERPKNTKSPTRKKSPMWRQNRRASLSRCYSHNDSRQRHLYVFFRSRQESPQLLDGRWQFNRLLSTRKEWTLVA
ncbi:MAG: hypothetical protein K2X93_01100 [Candidatus Obscuribacterales bacterium]|nr:hypothetical protein [Candidatus Obscuribacterales bacterium]